VIIRIPSLELVVPRNYRTLGDVGHSVMEYVINNIKVNTFNKKAKLQNNKKLLGIILYINKDKKIRYNYL
jgi:hypothetical protein